jgi:hypothetical protein
LEEWIGEGKPSAKEIRLQLSFALRSLELYTQDKNKSGK